LYARTNRRENLIGELVKEVTRIAKEEKCAISIENLKFKNDKDIKRKFSRIIHQFIYSKLLSMLEVRAKRENIEVFKVKPQFTSKIGLYKYSHQYGLYIHNAASIVIARRALDFNEKVPKILKDKLIDKKELDKFNKYNNWKQWSIINKKIKKKGGEKPGLWQTYRKSFLNFV
ncbi:IS200/IS605 family accessory protein TnpB-related protein, partial [Senegalia sp. (in: firmicutes)]|uniref:IS200/IS605 family accessory protein TnpB-related protein n=1 Tax=Senegalia sp. (in: firmicutes) TaxID=1924098 RepID=UPI003F954B3C